MTQRVLPRTQLVTHDDVHTAIELAQEKAGTILTRRLNYTGADGAMFAMVLSELMQNVIEHAEAPGWAECTVSNDACFIDIVDAGVGFRGSLAREHAARYGHRWSDETALQAVFLEGATRFRDPGRGQGLKQVTQRVNRWEGELLVTSGAALGRMAQGTWAWDVASKPHQGVRIHLRLPKRQR